MVVTTFDPGEERSIAEMEAEARALAQGEQLTEALQLDKDAHYAEIERTSQEAALIGGKFKSQEELLRAYKELESKLGKKPKEEEEEAEEEPAEATEEDSEEEEVEEPKGESYELFNRAYADFEANGDLSEEAFQELTKMSSDQLIKSYLDFYGKKSQEVQQVAIQESQIQDIKKSVGGDAAYAEMVAWAAENLPESEVNDYNAVTSSGDPVAIKFAVQALSSRYKEAVGYEGKLVTGKAPVAKGPKPYRSQAELARDIANRKYETDPAFRSDVMARLAVSQDLL